MDDQRFDALTRAMARGSSRRTAVKGLLLGVAGGVSLTMRQDRAGAQPQCVDSSDCYPCQECNQGECSYPVSYPNGVCCGSEGNYYCAEECCDSSMCDGCSSCVGGICVADECCTSADCPSYEDQCGTNQCISGECVPTQNCTGVQRCCGYGTSGAYCATCCSDEECPGCEICNLSGFCEQPECCADSDCTSVCGECVEGTCVSRCTGEEYCCAFANDCRAPGECCTDGDCPCGGSCSGGTCYPQPPCLEGQVCCEFDGGSTCQECCGDSDCDGNCETCVEGACVTACNPDEECCGVQCVPLGQCAHLCIPESQTCAGSQLECCGGLTCCVDGDVSSCAECCSDADCPNCSYCSEGICYGECSQNQECCNDVCVPIGQCAHICIAQSQPCADRELECCIGLTCCVDGETSFCAECCVNADCDHGGWCHHGECKYPHVCKNDHQCPKGTCCCGDGACSSKCCHHPHPPKPAPTGGDVSTLPATGAGPSDERNSLLGVTALGAAAALVAARKLSKTPDPIDN